MDTEIALSQGMIMKSQRLAMLLALCLMGILIVVLSPPPRSPERFSLAWPTIRWPQDETTEALLREMKYLTQKEKELYREGNAESRTILTTLNDLRQRQSEDPNLFDGSSDETERATLAKELHRYEKVATAMQQNSPTSEDVSPF